jgi:hypothetical protein
MVHIQESYFIGAYLNQNGHISRFLVQFVDSKYTIESTGGSMVLLSLPT